MVTAYPIIVVFIGLFSMTICSDVFQKDVNALVSSNQLPIMEERNIEWEVDCARLCSTDDKCDYVSYNESEHLCSLFSGIENITCNLKIDLGSTPTGSENNIYIKQQSMVCCNGGNKTADGSCHCINSYVGERCERLMQDCSEGFESGFYNGEATAFKILPILSTSPFDVHCHMIDGGKTFIQTQSIWENPISGTSFNQNWQDYVGGFGPLAGGPTNHWLGLDHVHEITESRSQDLFLNIHVKPTYENKTRVYKNFKISNETTDFRFTFDITTGSTAWPLGDCLSSLRNIPFSTYDKDNDGSASKNCGSDANSGWWFDSSCSRCNLNAKINILRSSGGAYWEDGFNLGDAIIVHAEMYLVAQP